MWKVIETSISKSLYTSKKYNETFQSLLRVFNAKISMGKLGQIESCYK